MADNARVCLCCVLKWVANGSRRLRVKFCLFHFGSFTFQTQLSVTADNLFAIKGPSSGGLSLGGSFEGTGLRQWRNETLAQGTDQNGTLSISSSVFFLAGFLLAQLKKNKMKYKRYGELHAYSRHIIHIIDRDNALTNILLCTNRPATYIRGTNAFHVQ